MMVAAAWRTAERWIVESGCWAMTDRVRVPADAAEKTSRGRLLGRGAGLFGAVAAVAAGDLVDPTRAFAQARSQSVLVVDWQTNTRNVRTTGLSYRRGIDLLPVPVLIPADSADYYMITIFSTSWFNTLPGYGARLSLNMDGLDYGAFADLRAADKPYEVPLHASTVIQAQGNPKVPGSHEINVRMQALGGGTAVVRCGNGGTNIPKQLVVLATLFPS